MTIKAGPKLLFPVKGKEGCFENHAFFEASSIRKVDGRYCFVYSSQNNHELCYATAEKPDGPYEYGGTLVDLGDLYLNGNEDESRAVNYLGNTHGGMAKIGSEWYIFYHRHTNRSSYARQACAEKLERTKDGGFRQAEVTSCGLNGGPLGGTGSYEARIACNLWSAEGTGRYDCRSPKKRFRNHPYFTQTGGDREGDGDQYIANMRNGAVAGFKYFRMDGADTILVEVRGNADGNMQVSEHPDFSEISADIRIRLAAGETGSFTGSFHMEPGKRALYIRYLGDGAVDFLRFELKMSETGAQDGNPA